MTKPSYRIILGAAFAVAIAADAAFNPAQSFTADDLYGKRTCWFLDISWGGYTIDNIRLRQEIIDRAEFDRVAFGQTLKSSINGQKNVVRFINRKDGSYSRQYIEVPCYPPKEDAGGQSVGGGFFERSGIQTYVGLEVGGGGAKATYDELSIDPKSFVGGVFMGVRIPQPSDWFIGVQAGFFATDLTREAAPRFEVGLRYGWTLDAQVGKTIQTAWRPIRLYVYAGPMAGITRTVSAGITDHFTLFGVTAGAGAEVDVTKDWSVGGRLRWFSLDPSDAKSQGQHVDGVIGTVSASYRF